MINLASMPFLFHGTTAYTQRKSAPTFTPSVRKILRMFIIIIINDGGMDAVAGGAAFELSLARHRRLCFVSGFISLPFPFENIFAIRKKTIV